MTKIRQSVSWFSIALLGACLPMITACTAAFMSAANYGVFQEEDFNLAERNYAAADYLIQQADTFVKKTHLIKAAPLNDIKNQSITTVFGRIIPEQVGVRLSQLGYRLDLQDVATGTDTAFLRPDMAAGVQSADFLLSGTYMERAQDIEVNLRLIDVRTNRVAAAFNYMLPYTRTISDLLDESRPRAYRLIDAQ